jgi:predicted ATP-dependent endonuclease of OLD family
MHIAFIEVANFRKLKSVRIELDKATTLFVGANNSGKTSAMVALRYFLRNRGGFTINDFTISHRCRIIEIGNAWIANARLQEPEAPKLTDWGEVLPTMDIWLDAKETDLHYVSHILPTLDWSGGYLGVRLRLQPDDIETLYRDFIETNDSTSSAKAGAKNPVDGTPIEVKLWPTDLVDFLSRRLVKHFEVAAYILDPAKLVSPQNGIGILQMLPPEAAPITGDPFSDLLLIDEIPAQRGFLDAPGDTASRSSNREARRLAKQFVDYFSRHLNPQDKPDSTDIVALKAIEDAQKAYDERLKISFSGPLKEMEGLGYPGVTDPRVRISTRLQPVDGLGHDAAVQYEISALKEATAAILPEDYNGLGYQNLISMVFRLMSFRDAWMRVGKAKTNEEDAELGNYPPLHLVLIEEPEAHLHVQVQQVFIRKAYDVLRNHPMLGLSENFATQLIVSTHSSHVAHEADFSSIRYFKRLPAGYPSPNGVETSVPISTVINLTEAFGDETETNRFVKRYLRATHCDLFFADAAVFVEGSAERILLPHFVAKEFKYLSQCYISWLEVGGSHAHRLRPLIERLGVLTLIITDIDACEPMKNRKSARPIIGKSQETNNTTLRTWLPNKDKIDELLILTESDKVLEGEPLFAVRVAYQVPIEIERQGKKVSVSPYTFEDAIALENTAAIQKMNGTGLLGKFAALIDADSDAITLAEGLYDALDGKKKAEFALDILVYKTETNPPRCPGYIAEALSWLQTRLKSNKAEVLDPIVVTAEVIGTALAQVAVATQNQGEPPSVAAVAAVAVAGVQK